MKYNIYISKCELITMQNKKQIKTQTNNAQKVFDVKRMIHNDVHTEKALESKFIYIVRDTLEYVVIGANSKETDIEEEADKLLQNCDDFIGAMRGHGFLLRLTKTL